MAGVPEPAVNGNSPQTWVVVAWYSGAAATCAARPAPGIFHPHAGGTGVWRAGEAVPGPAGQLAGWPGLAGRGDRAGCSDVMTVPGASGASAGPVLRGRSRTG